MITIKYLGAILLFLCEKLGSYGWAILVFGLIVKLIMLPFQMKSKKSMMRTSILTPRLKELEKRYKGNQQKYQEEVSRLYREAGVNPMSGCLWTLIPFPIIIILYRVVIRPLTNMMGMAAEEITKLTELMTGLGYYTATSGRGSYYDELRLADALHSHYAEITANPAVAEFADKLKSINFNFLGLNLSDTPQLAFWNVGTWAAFVLFLIPFISAGLSYLQMAVAQKSQPAVDRQAGQTAKTMNLMMPLMSLWICFSMPALMGVYWIEQSVLAMIQEEILNRIYKRQVDAEMADFLAAEQAREEEIERRRAETERLRAEGKTQVNTNTSKKRLAAKERSDAEQRQAAQRAAERAAMGLAEEIPASQVGTRRYARGRAYDPDRYADEAAGVPAAEPTEEPAQAPALEPAEQNEE